MMRYVVRRDDIEENKEERKAESNETGKAEFNG